MGVKDNIPNIQIYLKSTCCTAIFRQSSVRHVVDTAPTGNAIFTFNDYCFFCKCLTNGLTDYCPVCWPIWRRTQDKQLDNVGQVLPAEWKESSLKVPTSQVSTEGDQMFRFQNYLWKEEVYRRWKAGCLCLFPVVVVVVVCIGVVCDVVVVRQWGTPTVHVGNMEVFLLHEPDMSTWF